MRRLLTNTQMAETKGSIAGYPAYDFRTDEMREVCKAQDAKTLRAVRRWLQAVTDLDITMFDEEFSQKH